MRLARARAIVDDVLANASAPVSVFVADAHGELVAAATMDGAAPDTRLNTYLEHVGWGVVLHDRIEMSARAQPALRRTDREPRASLAGLLDHLVLERHAELSTPTPPDLKPQPGILRQRSRHPMC